MVVDIIITTPTLSRSHREYTDQSGPGFLSHLKTRPTGSATRFHCICPEGPDPREMIHCCGIDGPVRAISNQHTPRNKG